jgi:hypothetical protein
MEGRNVRKGKRSREEEGREGDRWKEEEGKRGGQEGTRTPKHVHTYTSIYSLTFNQWNEDRVVASQAL